MANGWQIMGKGKHNFVPNSRKCERCRSAYATSEITTATEHVWLCAPCAGHWWDEHQRKLQA